MYKRQALTPNATKAKYTAGQQVTVTDDYTLYAVYKKMPYKVTFNNNAGTSTSTVSYTHLDVYKRQILKRLQIISINSARTAIISAAIV